MYQPRTRAISFLGITLVTALMVAARAPTVNRAAPGTEQLFQQSQEAQSRAATRAAAATLRAATQPHNRQCAIYVRSMQVGANQGCSMVLEAINNSGESAIVIPQVYLDWKTVPPRNVLARRKIPEDSVDVIAVLHVIIPAPPTQGVIPPDDTLMSLVPRTKRRIPTGPDVLPDGRLDLADGTSTLNRVDLPARSLQHGDMAVELTLMQHGKTLTSSGVVHLLCEGATPASRPEWTVEPTPR
jgi:hypothetical protein